MKLLASCMTKCLTATLVQELAGELGVPLSTDAREIAQPFATPALERLLSGIQLRHLLNHSHGLDDPHAVISKFPRRDDGRIDMHALCERLSSAPRLIEPGRFFSYSDVGPVIAAGLMEAAFDRPFAELLRDRLLARFGIPYPSPSLGSKSSVPDICPTSGGDLKLSATDLIAFAEYHCGVGGAARNAECDPALLRAEVLPFPGWSPAGMGQCAGWDCFAGGWYGYNAVTPAGGSFVLRFNPELQTAAVVVSSEMTAQHLFNTVLLKQLPGYVPIQPPQIYTPAQSRALDKQRYVGRYESGCLAAHVAVNADGDLELTIVNRSSDLKLLRQPIVRLMRLGPDEQFFVSPLEVRFIPHGRFFEPADDGKHFNYLWGGRQIWRRV